MIRATFALTKTTAFSSQPQSTNFEQNLRGRCTLLASLPKWEEHLDRLECEKLQLLIGANLRPVAYEIFARELSAFAMLKFWQDNLVFKALKG